MKHVIKKNRKNTKDTKMLLGLLGIIFSSILYWFNYTQEYIIENNYYTEIYNLNNIPEYNGKIYVEINNNISNFTSEDMSIKEDYYSNLNNGKVRNVYDKDELFKV